MEPIIIQAEPTAKEVNQATFEHRCNTVLMAPLVVIIVFSAIAELGAIVQFADSPVFKIVPESVTFGMCAVIPFLLSFLYFNLEKNADFTFGITPRKIKYLFNDDGVQLIDEQGTSFPKWKEISHAYDCLDSLSLIINSIAFVIPKRNFKDGEQLKNVRNLIKQHVANFSYAKGNRKSVEFENTYENSMNSVEVKLLGPEAAKVVLKCRYTGAELSDFLWRYVSRRRYVFRSTAFFILYILLIHFFFWEIVEVSRDYEWIVPILTAIGCFAYYKYHKSRRFKTVQSCYDGSYRAVIEIGNDRLLFKTKGLKTGISWSEIIEVHETTRYYILKTAYALLVIIPKISLNSDYKRMFVNNLLRRKKTEVNKKLKAKEG